MSSPTTASILLLYNSPKLLYTAFSCPVQRQIPLHIGKGLARLVKSRKYKMRSILPLCSHYDINSDNDNWITLSLWLRIMQVTFCSRISRLQMQCSQIKSLAGFEERPKASIHFDLLKEDTWFKNDESISSSVFFSLGFCLPCTVRSFFSVNGFCCSFLAKGMFPRTSSTSCPFWSISVTTKSCHLKWLC